jgi:hypothetical protein
LWRANRPTMNSRSPRGFRHEQTARQDPSVIGGRDAAEPKRKDEQWDDRLRRVGDANYVAVDWTANDKPCWPLPMD